MNDQDSFDNIDQLLFHLGKFTYSVYYSLLHQLCYLGLALAY